MWPRKRIDISWFDMLYGVCRSIFTLRQDRMIHDIAVQWAGPDHTLVCLSVRSGFDLLLTALNLPRGSEVLISAITIPDMIRIIEHHDLVPIPVDLELQSMAPSDEAWQKAVTSKTKAILIAHLFGGRTRMEPILKIAHQYKLWVIEDCAQAFSGLEYQGHPEVDASMFSFGLIKANTALGGAVFRIRDNKILVKMQTVQANFPKQNRWHYIRRLIQAACFKIFACRPLCSMIVGVCRTIGYDYDFWINHASRGFPGEGLIAKLRHQPSSPLLALLRWRLKNADRCRVDLQKANGKLLTTMLQASFLCPGATIDPHTYWVFPIMVENPKLLIDRLACEGFDATQGHSLCVVPPPSQQRQHKARVAEDILAKMVFLPFYPEMTLQEIHRMAVVAQEWSHTTTH